MGRLACLLRAAAAGILAGASLGCAPEGGGVVVAPVANGGASVEPVAPRPPAEVTVQRTFVPPAAGTAVPASVEPVSDPNSCKGMNACKGQGGCKTTQHACKAQNPCKGQGGCRV
jgi:hypothetical protein